MKLKEFIENLNRLVEDCPEALNMKVISSIDEEGNGFNAVTLPPTIGYYEDDEFVSYMQYKEYDIDKSDSNAVCIN